MFPDFTLSESVSLVFPCVFPCVFIERFAGVRLGPGTLYGAITRLEERGWIGPVKSRDDRRQPYRITAAGRNTSTNSSPA